MKTPSAGSSAGNLAGHLCGLCWAACWAAWAGWAGLQKTHRLQQLLRLCPAGCGCCHRWTAPESPLQAWQPPFNETSLLPNTHLSDTLKSDGHLLHPVLAIMQVLNKNGIQKAVSLMHMMPSAHHTCMVMLSHLDCALRWMRWTPLQLPLTQLLSPPQPPVLSYEAPAAAAGPRRCGQERSRCAL